MLIHRLLNKLRSEASCLYTGCFFEKSVFDILRTFHRFARAYRFSRFLKRQFCFLSQNAILPNPIKLPIKKSKLHQQLTSLLDLSSSFKSLIGSHPHMLKLRQLTFICSKPTTETLGKDVKTCSKLKICSASMTLFWCLHCWLWTSKCWLGRYFKMLFKILIFRILTHFIPQVPSYNP